MKAYVKQAVRECDVCQCNKQENVLPPISCKHCLYQKKHGRISQWISYREIASDTKKEFHFGSSGQIEKVCTLPCLKTSLHSSTSGPNSFYRSFETLWCSPIYSSDRDKVFLSEFWQKNFQLQSTTLKHSTSYHPQTNGQTERMNLCLETYLHCFCNIKSQDWGKWLSWALYWYNTTWKTSADFTPYEALYDRSPSQPCSMFQKLLRYNQ